MASSNRHWPSLFKSKPCSTHQWQHDILSTQKPSFNSGLGEERSPEPKPRWNPKPEQIRILESIFNSGMVNPPRDEIRKIRAQLQEYGQVGDANVFYWFQNRKSRSKHKQRHLQSTAGRHNSRASHAPPPPPAAPTSTAPLTVAATSTSSSSSERSTGSDKILPLASVGFTGMMEVPPTAAVASPTASVNQSYFQSAPTTEFLVEPTVYLQQQGFSLSTSAGDLSGVLAVPEPTIGLVPGLWTELMMGQDGFKTGGVEPSKTAKIQNPNPNFSYSANSAAPASTCVTTETVAGPVNEIQGIGGGVGGGARLTVFINGVGFEAVTGIFNVREVFGEEAVLIHASGNPVLTDEWGRILHPLQHGASYFLVNI